ncbi:hypothetical protein Tco_0453645 [Tanacetum coccineum]
MANLKYSDKHNMVAFLKKPNGSDDFHQIVDFLKLTPLRYALIHNPTIYDSLVKQFWQTATVRTIANGNQELLATVDGKEYTITEAFVRSSLQLAEATGITNLPDVEIHEGLATMSTENTGLHIAPTLTKKIFGNMKRGFVGNHVPLLPAMLAPSQAPIADEATTTSVKVKAEGAATITTSLEAGLASGNIHKSPLRSHDVPLPKVNASRSAEDSVKLNALMELRKSKKVVLSDPGGEKEENSSKQGRKNQDDKSKDFVTPLKISALGEAQEQDIDVVKERTESKEVNTCSTPVKSASPVMSASVFQETIQKSKKQTEQGKARFVEAIKLQAQLDAKVTEQIHTDEMIAKRMEEETELTDQQKQRMAQVQFEAQYNTEEDWDVIRAKLKANA